MKNLLEKTDIYYKKSTIYEIFSQAEDSRNIVYKTLLPLFKDKDIIDVGCGTGKYIKLFAPYAKTITGIDAAQNQLSIATKKIKNYNNVELICSDIAEISFLEKFDIAFASWVLGTITDIEKRLLVLNNIKKTLKRNGQIFLVENDVGGEFEEIRGRINDPEKRTEIYNNWLKEEGFQIKYKLETNFEFSSVQNAQNIIRTIWGEVAAQKVTKKYINHQIIILSWEK